MRAIILTVFVAGLLVTGKGIPEHKEPNTKPRTYRGHIFEHRADTIAIKEYRFESFCPLYQKKKNHYGLEK